MTKQEFIDALSAKLSEDLDETSVYNEMQYYAGYIDAELARGRSEEEIIGELGDPILIARNISESPRSARDNYTEDPYSEGYSEAAYRSGTENRTSDDGEWDYTEIPPYKEPEEQKMFDDGFFERQPKQQVERTDSAFRKPSGEFNWGLVTGILIVLLLFLLIISVAAHLIRVFWPLIVMIAVFTGLSSFFKRR
ncbi:MAG: DUF1700 domain-containing protein [Lachnospiraceae bacterium]|nr:DUF1700 domain-containing protein [Lachnospiraceae bacterium]